MWRSGKRSAANGNLQPISGIRINKGAARPVASPRFCSAVIRDAAARGACMKQHRAELSRGSRSPEAIWERADKPKRPSR